MHGYVKFIWCSTLCLCLQQNVILTSHLKDTCSNLLSIFHFVLMFDRKVTFAKDWCNITMAPVFVLLAFVSVSTYRCVPDCEKIDCHLYTPSENCSTICQFVSRLMCVKQAVGFRSMCWSYSIVESCATVKCVKFKHSYTPNVLWKPISSRDFPFFQVC